MVDIERDRLKEDVYKRDATGEFCRLDREVFVRDGVGLMTKGVLLVFPDFRYEAITLQEFVSDFTLHEPEKTHYDWENVQWTQR